MRKIIVQALFFLFLNPAYSQVDEISPPDYIKTITFNGNSEFSGTPIIKLGQRLNLQFDDLVGDEADYYYKISFYNYDWTPSALSKNEYMKGFDNMRIKNYKNSRNTLQIYTHYTLNIPNKQTKALKVSGNYRIEIYNDQDEIVFAKPFIVYENIASVQTQIKRSRELKYINSKQVVNFTISGGERLIFKNPDKNLNPLIIKNNNLKNSIYNLTPQFHEAQKLVYRYDQPSAFFGGNEYLYFDAKDVHATTLHIKKSELQKVYNLYLYSDQSRHHKGYVYNPDINGHFKINTLQGADKNIESEYVWVHFSLAYDKPLKNGEIHLYGGFNDFTTNASTLLTYNPETQQYEGRYLFKQGFYNYKYVLKHSDGSIDRNFFSGSFDKTENTYTVLAYYRAPGKRYDRIIGLGRANSQDITN